MPVHLREQLHAAAARSGRSINAELVHRLERSLAREQSVLGRLRQRQGEGSMQRRTLRRWSIAAGVLASAMIVGFSALVLNGATPAGSEVEAELPGATAGASRGSEAGSSRKPGHEQRRPGRGGRRRVRPACLPGLHDLARRHGESAGRIRSLEGPCVPEGQGKEGDLGERRPEQGAVSRLSVPELVHLRAERVRRGRPHDLDRNRRHVQARELPAVHHAGGRRVWRTKNMPAAHAALGVPGRPAGDQLGRRGHDRPE